VQVPNMPKLPPGVQLPPGVNIGAGGINTTRTACLDSARPVPADMHPPTQQHGKCGVGAVNKNGNTVTWETSCPQSDGSVVHSNGVAHYTGDTMEATIKTRVTGGTGGDQRILATHHRTLFGSLRCQMTRNRGGSKSI